jgi:hypothetical protein
MRNESAKKMRPTRFLERFLEARGMRASREASVSIAKSHFDVVRRTLDVPAYTQESGKPGARAQGDVFGGV